MGWRKPGFAEAWEAALVLLVLGAGTFLLAGLPATRAPGESSGIGDWSCAAATFDTLACSRRAQRALLEGRAVGRRSPPDPDAFAPMVPREREAR